MVYSHVEHDSEGLHVSYYDSAHHKEGSMELFLLNPTDGACIRENDRMEVSDLAETDSQAPVTLRVNHPDGSSDDIPCNHT